MFSFQKEIQTVKNIVLLSVEIEILYVRSFQPSVLFIENWKWCCSVCMNARFKAFQAECGRRLNHPWHVQFASSQVILSVFASPKFLNHYSVIHARKFLHWLHCIPYSPPAGWPYSLFLPTFHHIPIECIQSIDFAANISLSRLLSLLLMKIACSLNTDE